MAKKLESVIKKIPQLELTMPVEANEIFVKMPKQVAEKLWESGFEFYPWDLKLGTYRLVTSWATKEEAIELFVSEAKKFCSEL